MPVCVMAAAFLLGPRHFLQLPRRVHSPEAGSEGSGGAGSAHQALCSCPRGQLCRARSRAGRRWASHSPSSWRNMGVFLEPCAPPVSFCFWTMWGVRGGGGWPRCSGARIIGMQATPRAVCPGTCLGAGGSWKERPQTVAIFSSSPGCLGLRGGRGQPRSGGVAGHSV